MSRNFKCEHSEEFGRYLISEKSFEQGDLVLEERPLVSGPVALWMTDMVSKNRVYTCVCCHKEVDDYSACAHCLWPCCSFRCSQREDHNNLECKFLSLRGIQVTRDNFGMLIYLRILLCKRWKPNRYREYLTLCSIVSEVDEEVRAKRDNEIKMIWKFLALDCELKVSMEEVNRMYSVFQTNNFEIDHKDEDFRYKGEATYRFGSLFSHSCEANLEFTFYQVTDMDGDTHWNIYVMARKSIKVGEILTIAYSDQHLKLGTIARQGRILKNHSFICKCDRCKDKTEGGTSFQAMLCPACPGNLLPVDAMIPAVTPWSCDKCDCTKDAELVIKMLDSLKEVPYVLAERTDGDEESLKLAEDFIEMKRILLHPNHFYMNICAMHWLLYSDFTDKLLSPGKGAQDLFVKIIKRAENYLPLCLRFMPYSSSSELYDVIANAYAAYTLKSDDMHTFEEEDYTVSFKLRLSRRIASFIKQSLAWRRLNPYGWTVESLSLYVHWSKKVRDIEEEIQRQETLALMSIRFLFPEM